MDGLIWPTHKFWCSVHYARARPLAGFIRRGGEREGRGEEWKERRLKTSFYFLRNYNERSSSIANNKPTNEEHAR